MSASLVGSEMCIRDSRTHPTGAPGTNFVVVSGAAKFKLRTHEPSWHARAAKQPSHLCRESLEPNP
eukprot:6611221-Alexandrium_andersonii.AAC.1